MLNLDLRANIVVIAFKNIKITLCRFSVYGDVYITKISVTVMPECEIQHLLNIVNNCFMCLLLVYTTRRPVSFISIASGATILEQGSTLLKKECASLMRVFLNLGKCYMQGAS